MTRLLEAAGSLAKASTPQPFSTSKTSNWVARVGGLPDYIQHIAHGILRSQKVKDESKAIQMAIGVCKNPPASWDANAHAACAKAISEWEAKKAASHAKSAVQSSEAPPSLSTLLMLRESALVDVARIEQRIGVAGMVALLEQLGGPLQEAASSGWSPTMRRCASAMGEKERHDVYEGAQKVGMLSARESRSGPGSGQMRTVWHSWAVNGSRLGDYDGKPSKDEALKVLQSHLSEAPARVVTLPTTGEYLVANPSTYSGEVKYTAFPSEGAARHAAGLPAQPTLPEKSSKVAALGEGLLFSLDVLSGTDIPPLRRVQEARRRLPFDLSDTLAEAFHADELRGFHGRWIEGQNLHHVVSTSYRAKKFSPAATMPKPYRKPQIADAAGRYEGGVQRASAKVRAEHAAKPQIPLEHLPGSVGSGVWDRGAQRATREIIAGKIEDTEHAHRATRPDGKLGPYSAERTALHQEILNKLFQGKGTHDHPRAVFTAGGPASGKSAMISSGHVKPPSDAVHVNADVVREMLPEYKALKAQGRKDASSRTHEEASHISKLAMRIALGRGNHVLVDSVGNSGPGAFAGKVKAAMAAGHETSVHYATVPIAEAMKRADARGRKTGRFVPEGYLRAAHQSVSQVFPEVAGIKGAHVQVFDTSTRDVKLAAESKRGSDKLDIKHAKSFADFQSKAKG